MIAYTPKRVLLAGFLDWILVGIREKSFHFAGATAAGPGTTSLQTEALGINLTLTAAHI